MDTPSKKSTDMQLRDAAYKLARNGEYAEALELYERVADKCDGHVWVEIGLCHEYLRDIAGALDAYERGVACGDGWAAVHLGFKLRNDCEDADRAYTMMELAASRGQADALGFLAFWSWCDTENLELEDALREQAPHFSPAKDALIELLIKTERIDQAQTLLSELKADVEEGRAEWGTGWYDVGRLARALPDVELASECFLNGSANGDAASSRALGQMALERGDQQEAKHFLKLAADDGDRSAIRDLRRLQRAQKTERRRHGARGRHNDQ